MTRIVTTPAPGNTEPTVDKDRPRLLDRVKEALGYRHYSLRTERTYIHWIKRYIYFHKSRHPAEMGAQEVTQFLSYLAVEGEVSSSTQNQALAALLFLYKQVLDVELPWMDDITRSKRPKRLPTVLTRKEVTALLNHVPVRHALMARLIYGSGIRRRHHAHETAFQRAIKQAAANAELSKPVSTHTLRHSFATHLLEDGSTATRFRLNFSRISVRVAPISTSHRSPQPAPTQGASRL